jgi:hypothetical protein
MDDGQGGVCLWGMPPTPKSIPPTVSQDVPQISRSVPLVRAKGFFGQKHSPLI